MNKERFFEYCRQHNESDGIKLKISVHSDREIYPQVFLCGSWGRFVDDEFQTYQTSITLFTPQHKKDDFRTWHDTCKKRSEKFEKWLNEWYRLKEK